MVKNYQKQYLKKFNLLITFTSYFSKFKIWENIQIYKYFKKLKTKFIYFQSGFTVIVFVNKQLKTPWEGKHTKCNSDLCY